MFPHVFCTIVYPFALFSAFKIFENIFAEGIRKKEDCRTFTTNSILRVFIVVFTITIGVLSINRFDTLISLAGSAICTPIALIIPSLFHFSFFRKTQSTLISPLDIVVTVIGVSLSITTLVFTFI